MLQIMIRNIHNVRKNTFSLLIGGRYFVTIHSSEQFACSNMKSLVKANSLFQTSHRHFSTRKKYGGKSPYVALVPLSVLLFIIWAFVYGGLTLKRPQRMPMRSPENYDDETVYVSKVERLHNEKRARLYAEMQKLKNQDD